MCVSISCSSLIDFRGYVFLKETLFDDKIQALLGPFSGEIVEFSSTHVRYAMENVIALLLTSLQYHMICYVEHISIEKLFCASLC